MRSPEHGRPPVETGATRRRRGRTRPTLCNNLCNNLWMAYAV